MKTVIYIRENLIYGVWKNLSEAQANDKLLKIAREIAKDNGMDEIEGNDILIDGEYQAGKEGVSVIWDVWYFFKKTLDIWT